MPLSIARLRIWLLVGVALLVLVIAGFLGYARYRAHRFLAALPAKLGVDIRRETNGYTYSQSIKGKTVMTLHAAKAVEHANGKLTLHDVGMILYGRKQERMDRISGSEFEYDQGSGVVRALGEVHIDLERPGHGSTSGTEGKTHAAQSPGNTFPAEPDGDDPQIIHVKTSGLVYLQKLGIAATDQDLEFKFNGMNGHARGAEYNSDTGVLILQSEVRATGLQHGRSITLTASHAELERANQRALLTQASYASPGQMVRGDHAIVHLRSDGSPERIEAEGNVVLKSPTAGNVTAPHADVLLNETGQARNAHLFGGVRYEDVTSLRKGNGYADDAQIAFDNGGRPEKVVLRGAIRGNERTRATEAATSWSRREVTAETMTFAFVDDGTGRHKELRDIDASSAHLTLVDGAGTSELSGQTMHGNFTGLGKATQLSSVHGAGHTLLRRVNAQGAEQTSTGDSLDVTLRPAGKRAGSAARPASPAGSVEIVKAVQSGQVAMTSKPAPGPGNASPTVVRAVANVGIYDADADHLTLTGRAQVMDGDSTVSADKIVMEHASGDAIAEGAVKASYLQPNATERVHVVAERAELKRASNRTVFYGATGKGAAAKTARLWQGASQVEAPVLDFEQKERRLTARGDRADAVKAPVHVVLASSGGPSRSSSVVRIASHTMVYSDASRQADFVGEVKVEDADGVLRAHEATAYLQSASSAGAAASKKNPAKEVPAGVFFGGGVERIVASGTIEIDQPSRRAVGEKLVYTASDGMFVLTGTATALPELIDETQGTVTGTVLRFRTGDDSVMVTGDPHNPSQQVHTVTRGRQK